MATRRELEKKQLSTSRLRHRRIELGIVLSQLFCICTTEFRYARGVPLGKWVANMVDVAKTRKEATLSRRRLFDGIWRAVQSIRFALLIQTINNLIRDSRIDLHIPNLGYGEFARAEKIIRRPNLASRRKLHRSRWGCSRGEHGSPA